MKLFIKNMVCRRCEMVVLDLLAEMEISPVAVTLGEADLGARTLSDTERDRIAAKLADYGFALIDDRKHRLISRIKTGVIQLIQETDELGRLRISDYLSERLACDYDYLSRLFSATEGITIEQYIIRQKVEKIKELLVYDELTVKEISYRLGYSSPSHLSSQFKKVTGLSPGHFSRLRATKYRKSLDQL